MVQFYSSHTDTLEKLCVFFFFSNFTGVTHSRLLPC